MINEDLTRISTVPSSLSMQGFPMFFSVRLNLYKIEDVLVYIY